MYNELWETISSGKIWRGEFHNKKKNGELFWESASVSPILNEKGKIINYIKVAEDITEKKITEKELIEAKEKAEESNRLKSAFLANMSHEIRTPMNGILGFTNLLLEPDLGDDTKEEFIGIINKSGERMLKTVNDIIEISKVEAGIVEVNKSIIDLVEISKNLMNFFKFQAQQKGLMLSFYCDDMSLLIQTDESKLVSILTNLIRNAIKYTDYGEIQVNCLKKKDYIQFSVKDTGIGVPENRLTAIFNRFEQADIEDTRAYEGSGLGLAITKSYVEMLGGKIWVESVVGKGSEFYFTLPNLTEITKPTFSDIPEKNDTNDGFSQRIKILVVDDDKNSADLLKVYLKQVANTILYANSGQKAIEFCKNNPDIDLVLMDIKMHAINGLDATKEIRKFNKEVSIIAQSAYALSGDKEKAIEAGCNDYITKPIRKDKLLALIQNYF
jgi:signal transduction histidine kinase/CheY-like chemotaxis protein